MNFVTDCTDTSAPSASGRWFNGVANVVSTPRRAPRLRGAAQSTSRSATVSNVALAGARESRDPLVAIVGQRNHRCSGKLLEHRCDRRHAGGKGDRASHPGVPSSRE